MTQDRSGIGTMSHCPGTGRIPMRLADKRTANEAAHRSRDRKSKDQEVVDVPVDRDLTEPSDELRPEDHS
jgi:hypothetical protein